MTATVIVRSSLCAWFEVRNVNKRRTDTSGRRTLGVFFVSRRSGGRTHRRRYRADGTHSADAESLGPGTYDKHTPHAYMTNAPCVGGDDQRAARYYRSAPSAAARPINAVAILCVRLARVPFATCVPVPPRSLRSDIVILRIFRPQRDY